MNKILPASVVVCLLAIVVAVLYHPVPSTKGFSTDVTSYPLTNGVNATSSTLTSYTLIGGDFIGLSTLVLTPSTGNFTLTLPASSTLPSTFIPANGQSVSFMLVNGTSTRATTVTVAAGTGSLLANASTTAAVFGLRTMTLTATRLPTTDIVWSVVPYVY